MNQDLIFNGTGINYSWHFPRLFDLSPSELSAHRSTVFISGGSTALLVYWAIHKSLVTWSEKDFCYWSRYSKKAYGTGLISGARRVLKMRRGSEEAIFTADQYRAHWEMAVKPEFFQMKMKDLPKNVRIPLINRTSGEVEVVTPDSRFAETPAYLVSFAATAIPKIYPEIKLGNEVYGDLTFSPKFIPWLKSFEKESADFVNYNLLKHQSLPNGKYIKICDDPNPKKMMQTDNLKFIFGRTIPSFAENVRRSKLPAALRASGITPSKS